MPCFAYFLILSLLSKLIGNSDSLLWFYFKLMIEVINGLIKENIRNQSFMFLKSCSRTMRLKNIFSFVSFVWNERPYHRDLNSKGHFWKAIDFRMYFWLPNQPTLHLLSFTKTNFHLEFQWSVYCANYYYKPEFIIFNRLFMVTLIVYYNFDHVVINFGKNLGCC